MTGSYFWQRVFDTRVAPGGDPRRGPFQYHVVCHPEGSMETPVVKPDEAKWRCRNCHLEEEIKWQAYNDRSSDLCQVCTKPIEECGVCHWLNEDEMTRAELNQWKRTHAPEIIQALRKKWPKVTKGSVQRLFHDLTTFFRRRQDFLKEFRRFTVEVNVLC